MQVPGYIVSMYVATCGQNGPGLGSDEKDIILLVYVIIDAATNQIVGIKQYLVRPTGRPGLQQSQTQNNNNNLSINNNNNSGGIHGNSITNDLQTSQTILPQINSNNNNTILNNNNNNLNDLNITNNNYNNINSNNNNNTLEICDGLTPPIENLELPIAAALASGKPLKEAIDEFDAYICSLLDSSGTTDNSTLNFKLITDGQLPIRQCLHPEASAKDLELPSYYCKFSDLRKEYVRYKSQDLARALVPVKDIKKLPQMPALPPLPLSIGEMVKELELKPYQDNDFYVKESRDMVNVIQALLSAGHKFESNEMVNLQLEPGICSIDDEIDGSCIVRARGLPWQSSDQDIAKFFRGLNVAKGGVALCLSPLGRRNGEALVRFVSQEHRDMALKRHKNHIGNRYIEVYRATGDDFLSVAGGASNEAQAFLSKGAKVIIRMRGLPYDCTAKQVLDFFTTGENPVDVLDGVDGVLFVKKPDGRATGDAFVLFAKESDGPHALARHRESIGQRYIELFQSTIAEVQQVLNRLMDPKTYEQNNQPLIAQLPPPVQMPMLPQHFITSGTKKNCIRLRGLPYEARVEDILHFLDQFSKNIMCQGVHMVFNAQGQPSGEAFIQMDSEESARYCAQQKHNQFMVFGKKYRYIEVFQCCGDDMNLVLTGGIQSPVVNPTKPALLSPGGTLLGPPFGFPHFGHPTIFPAPPPHHRSNHHPTAYYPQPQIVYWPYPSPPVSPTTYYGPPPGTPTHHSQHVTPNLGHPHHQQVLFPVDYIPYQHHHPVNHHNQNYHLQASPTSSSPVNNSAPTPNAVLKSNGIITAGTTTQQQSTQLQQQQPQQSPQYPINVPTATIPSASVNTAAQFHPVTTISASPTMLNPANFDSTNSTSLYVPPIAAGIIQSPPPSQSGQHMLSIDTKMSNLAGQPLEYPYATYPQPYNGRILSPTPATTANSYSFAQSFHAGSVYSLNHYVELYST